MFLLSGIFRKRLWRPELGSAVPWLACRRPEPSSVSGTPWAFEELQGLGCEHLCPSAPVALLTCHLARKRVISRGGGRLGPPFFVLLKCQPC